MRQRPTHGLTTPVISAEALESRLHLAADLAASLTYTAGTYYPGQNLGAAVLNEFNVGDTEADGYRTRLVLSTDTVLGNGDDVEVAASERTDDPLAAGELDRTALTIAITPSVPAGRYFVIVQADSDAAVTENTEANNTWVSPAADVVVARPVVTITAIDRAAGETASGSNTGRFRITRTGPTGTALNVLYTISGTATPGSDFTALSGSVTIAANATAATITLAPINDTAVEGPERVILTLTATPGYTVGTASSARVDIADNDGARVTLIATDNSAAEQGAGTATFTVTRSGAGTDGDLVVNYTIGGTATSGSDYAALPGSVTIPDGQASAAITLTPIDDTDGELTENVILTLAPSTGYLIVASRRTARATITDNEPVVKIVASDATATEAGTTPGTATFVVTRTGSTVGDLVVSYTVGGTATSGSDFLALAGSVTIPGGAASASFTLTPINDAIAEPTENVVITLANGAGYRVDPATARRRATATIADNEPVVSILATDSAATENNTTTAAFTVSRTGSPTGALVVNYSVTGTATSGDDYIALPGSITIPDGALSATIILTPVNDTLGEGSEQVVITILAPAGSAYSRNNSRGTARATIADNEPSVSITSADTVATEAPLPTDPPPTANRTATFTVSRTGSTAGALTIPYTVSGSATPSGGADPADYTALSGTVTIPDGQSRADIVITPIDDGIAEPTETVIVTLGGNNGYLLSASRKSATATITDDEPVVSIVATDAAATEAAAPATPATANRTATFTVSRAAAGAADLTITYTIGGTAIVGTDYEVITTSITIPAGQTSAVITITPTQDALGEGDETIDITLAASTAYTLVTTGGKDRARAIIRDDEPVISIAATDNTATEHDQTTGTFTLTRTGSDADIAEALTVAYRVDGAADQEDDYDALDGEVTFAPGARTVTITIFAIDDLIGETPETVIIALEGGPDAEGGPAAYSVDAARATATVTITDNEPAVSITATDSAAAENNNPGVFTVRRTGDTSDDLVVAYTVSGTATSGADYAALSGTVTIPAGSASATITVTPVFDLITEPAETVIVALTPPADDAGYRLDTARQATVTIANAAAIDLALLSVNYFGRSYSMASTGVTSPIVINLANLGDAAAGAFTAEFRLSINDVWGDADDIVIGSRSVGSLAGSASATITFDFAFDTIKSRLAEGEYYLAVRIDSAARIAEASESNNTFFSAEPDFVVIA